MTEVFNAADDFSATSNPTKSWRYGYSTNLVGTFNLYTDKYTYQSVLDVWCRPGRGEPLVAYNGTNSTVYTGAIIQPGEIVFHPGPNGEKSIVRWTTPNSGSYDISATFSGADYFGATSTDVHVLDNGTSIFDGNVNGNSSISYHKTWNLAAGDTIDFTVGYGTNGNYYNDSTALDAVIKLLSPLTISSNNIKVLEGKDQKALILADFTNTDNKTITVTYTTKPDTATAGQDFTTTTGVLTIPVGQTKKTIEVPIINDDTNESDETFLINFSYNDKVDQIAPVVTITDTLESDKTATLPDGVENLKLTGNSNINGNGNKGNNVIEGNAGKNSLDGKLGNDSLFGQEGNDTLAGGSGQDIIFGGAGNDIYVEAFGDSLVRGRDRIGDFAIGSDKVDLLTNSGTSHPMPVSLSRAADTTASSLFILAKQVFVDSNGAESGNQPLGKNSAAIAVVTSGVTGTYLIVNDFGTGFNSSRDLVISITGYSGTLPVGSVAPSTLFV